MLDDGTEVHGGHQVGRATVVAAHKQVAVPPVVAALLTLTLSIGKLGPKSREIIIVCFIRFYYGTVMYCTYYSSTRLIQGFPP